MGLFNRRPTPATPELPNRTLATVARYGTWEEFSTFYRPSDVNRSYDGRWLLLEALSNKPEVRDAIVARLLADGVDCGVVTDSGLTALHLLFAKLRRGTDLAPVVRFAREFLERGADVNRVHPKEGTALELAMEGSPCSDAELAPLYDVLLARPEIDLLAISRFGRTVLDNVRTWADMRADLVARMEATLRDRGVPVPPPA